MKSRFKPESEVKLVPAENLADLESLDASEQMFAATLDATDARPVFTLREEQVSAVEDDGEDAISVAEGNETKQSDDGNAERVAPAEPQPEDANAWKEEVTARVSRYRSRRPRAPRYPSLLLKFDCPPQIPRPEPQAIPINLDAVATDTIALQAVPEPDVIEKSGRLLEFPRATMAPPMPLDELADPVPGLPRILDVPDAPAPLPALGGILIQNVRDEGSIRRPGFEIPLRGASTARRILASALDFAIILVALVSFGYIFLRITHQIPATFQIATMGAIIAGLLWAAYQYAFLVYAGSTPGLTIGKLQLSCFDGRPVGRKTRRWRVLAMVLSALSLGLGYIWCFLDEDQLCWHDRITTTYMAPKVSNPQNT